MLYQYCELIKHNEMAMHCGFLIFDEDSRRILAECKRPHYRIPVALMRTGESLVDCATRAYREMFVTEIPKHLISLADKDIYQNEWITIYKVSLSKDSAKSLPRHWVDLDMALQKFNPHRHLIGFALSEFGIQRSAPHSEKTVVIPNLIASLPSPLSSEMMRRFDSATLNHAALNTRMYRGVGETMKEAYGPRKMKIGNSFVWEFGPLYVFSKESGIIIECLEDTNPFQAVEEYRKLIDHMHQRFDEIGISPATV